MRIFRAGEFQKYPECMPTMPSKQKMLGGTILEERRTGRFFSASDVPPILSSTAIWSPIPNHKEIGREEALFRRTDHRLPA